MCFNSSPWDMLVKKCYQMCHLHDVPSTRLLQIAQFSAAMLFFILILSCCIVNGGKPPPKIGIVGGGIGGASAAYFLSRQLPGADITVFEMGNVGGRIATVEVDGRRYESGGSIIHLANKYMVEYLDHCGLNKRQPPQDDRFTFYKDGKMVFQEWGISLVDKMRLAWKYGIMQLLKLENFYTAMLANFINIYDKLDGGIGFLTLAELLRGMDPVSSKGKESEEMMDLTSISLKDKLESLGLDNSLVDELVTVPIKFHYGQLPQDVHAFVGAVGLIGFDRKLWAVEGGNMKVVTCALEMSKARMVHGKVEEVVASDSFFQLKYSTDSSGPQVITDQFDIVIIASPMTSDKARLTILPTSQEFPGSYQRVVANFVQGTLIPGSIGYNDNSSITPNNFYLSTTSPMWSVEKLFPVDYDPSTDNNLPPVYKLFSHKPLTSTELSTLFSSINSVSVSDWLAYPSYSTKNQFSSFQLSSGLYYINMVEWAASAMEMSIIGAKNVANLATKHWMDDMLEMDEDKHQEQIKKSEL